MNMEKRFRLASQLLLIGLAFTATSIYATPVTGTLNLTGSVSVTQTSISFLPAGIPGYGVFNVVIPGTGTFGPLVGSTGDIHNLDQVNEPGGTNLTLLYPPDGLDNFIFFNSPLGAGIDLTLTIVQKGIYTSAACGAVAAVGQNCTPNIGNPPFSIYNLSNIDNGAGGISSTASFIVNGIAISPQGDKSNYQGTFSTQFTNQSYQDVLQELATQGTVQASFSANITVGPVIPEPGTLTLLTAGGLFFLVGLVLRHRKNAA